MTDVTQEPAGLQVPLGIDARALVTPATYLPPPRGPGSFKPTDTFITWGQTAKQITAAVAFFFFFYLQRSIVEDWKFSEQSKPVWGGFCCGSHSFSETLILPVIPTSWRAGLIQIWRPASRQVFIPAQFSSVHARRFLSFFFNGLKPKLHKTGNKVLP